MTSQPNPVPRIVCGALLTICLLACAADRPAKEKTGLAVGTKAPTFTLKDQDAKERSLADFLPKGKVALVFFRSAGW